MIGSSDFGGLIARVMPRSRAQSPVPRRQVGAHQTAASGQATPPGRSPRLEQAASIAEIVDAVRLAGLSRLIVVSTSASREPGGIDLVRGLAAEGTTAVLIDLTPCDRIAELSGLERGQRGIGAIAAGTASLAQIIHRDRHSAAHVVPSGGFRIDPGSEGLAAHLRLVLDAFSQVYGCSVIEFDRAAIAGLPLLLDAQTAIVLALSAGDEGVANSLDAGLRSIGLEDVITMRIPPGVTG